LSAGDPPPSNPWSILYNDALLAWLDTRPSVDRVERVVAWIEQCKAEGPPAHAVLVRGDEPDWFYAVVPGTEEHGTRVVIEYLVVHDDREALIIVRSIA